MSLNLYNIQGEKENDEEKKIIMLLKNSDRGESVEEINKFISRINTTIDSNKKKVIN